MSYVNDQPDWLALAGAIPQLNSAAADVADPLGIHVRLLTLLGSGASLGTVLEGLARYVEGWTDGLLCSVMLVEETGKRLRLGAAPSFPDGYAEAARVVSIAEGEGSCGTAAARKQRVIVDDVETSALWRRYASLAVSFGLRACWSVPVLDDAQRLVGTLALYYTVPRRPSGAEIKFIEFAAQLTAFVIRRHAELAELRNGAARLSAVAGTGIGLWERVATSDRRWLDDWCGRLDIDPCDGANFEDRWCAQIHPADISRYRSRRAASAPVSAGPYVIDYRVRTARGDWRWVQERSAPEVPDADGTLMSRIGVCIDIDERKRAEFERSLAAERYRALARLVRAHVFEAHIDSNGRIEFTWADDEFAEIFGCAREELNRRGWQSFVDPRDRGAAVDRLSALGRGETVEIELRVCSVTGERRWLRMAAESLAAATPDGDASVIGMAEDITNRKALVEHMLGAIHGEQRRIGADLHDGLGQVLTGVSLLLRSCQTRALRGEAVAPDQIEHLIELVNGAIETTRGLAYGLAPGTTEYGGLFFALSALAQHYRQSGLPIELAAPGEFTLAIDSATADHLYRIVQEAVTNVVRHANATQVNIDVSVSPEALIIDVIDDGSGIPEGRRSGFGLHSMHYRADAIGAMLSVARLQPRGTRVRVRLKR